MSKKREKAIQKISESLIPNIATLMNKIDKIEMTSDLADDELVLLAQAHVCLANAQGYLSEIIKQDGKGGNDETA